jgi:hypothetical protein
VEFLPSGESDDVVPKGLGPPSLCTDEEAQKTAGGVGRLLIADGVNGEGMGGELVGGGDGEEEVLSGSPWSTFWGKNGETDYLAEKRDVVVTFGRGYNVKMSRDTGMREPLRD